MAQTLTWQANADNTGDILAGDGKILATYHWGPERRQPFLHPVASYQSPEPLTTFAPWDHRWHKGLWWAWKYINGINFWENFTAMGPGEGISQVVAHAATTTDDHIVITQALAMSDVQTRQCLMTEQRVLTIAPTWGDHPSAWSIDWDATFTAQVDCELTATPYPEYAWGGYAGLNYRPSRTMGTRETILASTGALGAAAVHSHAATWVAYGGVLDGDEDITRTEPPLAGIALITRAAEPLPYYAFSAQGDFGFGFLATAPLMHGPLTLAAGASLPFHHRVVVFDGAIPVATLHELG